MTRTKLTTLLTVLFLGAALAVSVARSKNWSTADLSPKSLAAAFETKPQAPEDAVYGMLDAARVGDTRKYLASFTGQIREQLDRTAQETGATNFSQYLRKTNAAIQGVALRPAEPVVSGEMKLRVEYVYRDRNEVQFLYLKNEGPQWRITRVDSSERVKTLVPFGAPVTD